jgi:hypothetical protein
MTDDEMKLAIIAAVKAAHDAESLHDTAGCKVRWRRRMAVMVIVIIIMYALGEYLHLEAMVKGWEFLGAAVTDKLIFGISGE